MGAFSLILGISGSLGLLRIFERVPRDEIPRWIKSGLWMMTGCLIGARFLYVVVRWEYFSAHLAEIPQVWLGGLSMAGAVAGGLVMFLLLAALQRTVPLILADRLGLLLLPLGIGLWLGCWMAGCAYGNALPDGTWWGMMTADESGLLSLRVPLQLLGASSLLLYFMWCESPKRRAIPGRVGILSGLGAAVNLLVFSFLRADPVYTWNGFGLDAWAGLGLTVICLAGLIFTVRGNFPPQPEELFRLDRL
jgi:phosphatidylglycerol---prolipoprotein diacylglyceryl transferase